MAPKKTTEIIEAIEARIVVIQGKRVLLSPDLAQIYGVPTKVLVQAVKRNIIRFPKDFMFHLSDPDREILKSQFVTSSWGGARRANPYAFTQEGVAMLSSVLRSARAVRMNIAIMRAFVKFREGQLVNALAIHLLKKIDGKLDRHDAKIDLVMEAMRGLGISANEKDERSIGFRPD